jgi:hypothetical protein
MEKRIGAAFIFSILVMVSCFSQSDTNIIINRIKIVINGTLYIWETEDERPASDTGKETDPFTVISFLSISPGQVISEKGLIREIELTRYRLRSSGYFSAVYTAIVPPRKFPDKRTVLVKVTDGFRSRFGGNNAYGYFGMENCWGKRKSFRLFAGYNKCGALFLDHALLNTNILLGAAAYYLNAGLGVVGDRFYEQLRMEFMTGIRVHPDWLIGLKTGMQFVWYPDNNEIPKNREFILTPQFNGRIYFGEDHFPLIMDADLFAPIVLQQESDRPLITIHPLIRLLWTPLENHVVRITLAAGFSFSTLPLHHACNLYDNPDTTIRSGYEMSELFCDEFALASCEYSVTVVHFLIPPVFNIKIQPFLFADLALAGGYPMFEHLSLSGISSFYRDAYGFGLNIIFADPVFLTASLSYGWNNEGRGRLTYAFKGNLQHGF